MLKTHWELTKGAFTWKHQVSRRNGSGIQDATKR